MLRTIVVTAATAALGISQATWAQERAPGPGGGAGEPGLNSPAGTTKAPSVKAPTEKLGTPSRSEKNMSGDDQSRPAQSRPVMRADEQKGNARSENANPQQERGSQQNPGVEERGAQENHSSGQRTGQISPEQKTKLRTGFKGVQVREASGVNVTNVQIGANIPRTVSEYWQPVPVTILNIVPEWNGYRVVRIGDEIVIIDPATFEIVYVF